MRSRHHLRCHDPPWSRKHCPTSDTWESGTGGALQNLTPRRCCNVCGKFAILCTGGTCPLPFQWLLVLTTKFKLNTWSVIKVKVKTKDNVLKSWIWKSLYLFVLRQKDLKCAHTGLVSTEDDCLVWIVCLFRIVLYTKPNLTHSNFQIIENNILNWWIDLVRKKVPFLEVTHKVK